MKHTLTIVALVAALIGYSLFIETEPAQEPRQTLADRVRELEQELAELRRVVASQQQELATLYRLLAANQESLERHLEREHDLPVGHAPIPQVESPAPAEPSQACATAPARDRGDWPRVQRVTVEIDPRGRPALVGESFSARDAGWVAEDGWRHSTSYAELDDLAVFVWREQWEGRDATRITIALVNGFPDRGIAYFESARFLLGRDAVFERAQHDCILPRGSLVRRFWTGPDAADLKTWKHIKPYGPSLPWMPALCRSGLERAKRRARQVGPYLIGDPEVSGSGSLDGSHGGHRIAPFWGGEDGWQVSCRDGLRWMGEDWLLTWARSPIALLEGGSGNWKNPHSPYWAGSTNGHEPAGYLFVDLVPGGSWNWPPHDGWCAYERELARYRSHDYTHYRRAYAAAAAVARHDIVARWYLTVVCWGNLAAWLDGAPSESHLLQWLPQMMQTPKHEGDSRGGRGWGHTLGCFLAAEPWLPEELASPSWGGSWREALAKLTKHWAMPENGWTHAASTQGFPTPSSGWDDLTSPIAASRELDLVGVWFDALGLRKLDGAWRRSLRPVKQQNGNWISVGEHLEVRHVKHWTRVHWRNRDCQPQYDLFRGAYERFGGLKSIVRQAGQGDPSPDELLLDNLARQEWQATIR